MKVNRVTLTQGEAQAIVDSHEIQQLMDNAEERDLLYANNYILFTAYQRLLKIADGQ